MSVSPDRLKSLDDLPVDQVQPNPENPRLIFKEDEMERLSESIASKGVLVPIVVYRDGDLFTIVDGERRWRCAKDLGLATIPAVIVAAPNRRENLEQMFNIHMVREPWADMPTAWALEKLIEETGIDSERELSDLTGLSGERLRRLRHALSLPPEYQKYIHEGSIPLNFFWELKRNVIDALAKHRPVIFDQFGLDGIREAFVRKRLDKVVTDTVALRDVRPIIIMAGREAEDVGKPSPLDDTLRDLITNPEMTIAEAYEDTVQVLVETDKLQRRSENMAKGFQRLLEKARTPEETEYVRNVARALMARLTELID